MNESPSRIELVSNQPRMTHDLGVLIGKNLPVGVLVALSGPLGAGKTQLVKGIARGLEVDESEPVVSPTFVLVREYAGRRRLVHADVYRLQSADEVDALGLGERLESGDAVVVEWADRFADRWTADTLWIDLAHLTPTRHMRISSADPRWLATLAGQISSYTASLTQLDVPQ